MVISTGHASYFDVSDRSLLALEGTDGLDLLQRISTNDVSKLKVGEHAESVLTTEKGRILDVLVLYRASANSLILAGLSKKGGQLNDWIGRFIVMEDARLTSLAGDRFQCLVFNLQDLDVIAELAKQNIIVIQLKYPNVQQALCIAEKESKSFLESFMGDRGIMRVTTEQYGTYRIQNGIPGYPNEVSLQFNPLEIGLKSLISFTKGCYVGQEVIARLDTYRKAQETLQRFILSVVPGQLPTELFSEAKKKAGVLTSSTKAAQPGEQIYGLGLVVPDVDGSRLIYSGPGNDLNGIAEVITE